MLLRRDRILLDNVAVARPKPSTPVSSKKSAEVAKKPASGPPAQQQAVAQKKQQTPKPGGKKPQTSQKKTVITAKPTSADIPYAAYKALAAGGVNFMEVYEAGLGPQAEKTRKAQRRAMANVASAAAEAAEKEAERKQLPGYAARQARKAAVSIAGSAAAKQVQKARRLAIAASIAASPGGSRQLQQKFKEQVKTIVKKMEETYKKTLEETKKKIEQQAAAAKAEAQQKLHQLQQQYMEYKQKGVKKVKVDTDGDGKPDKVMTLEEWYEYNKKRLTDYIKKVEEWEKTEKAKIEKKIEEIKRAATSPENLSAIVSSATFGAIDELRKQMPKLAKAVAEAYKEWSKTVEQNYRQWLQQAATLAARVTTKEQAESYANDVYQKAYQYWLSAGMTPEEAKKKAEEARKLVLEKALASASKVSRFMEEAKKLAQKYQQDIVALSVYAGASKYGSEFYREAMRNIDELRDKLYQLAKKYGLSDDVARDLISQIIGQVSASKTSALRFGKAQAQLQQLLQQYTEQLQKLAQQTAAGIATLKAMKEMEQDYIKKIQSLAEKYNLPQDLVNKYIENIRSVTEQAKKLRREAEKIEKQKEKIKEKQKAYKRAEDIYNTYLNEALRSTSFAVANVDELAEKLRTKILNELGKKLGKEEAEKLANYYAQKLRQQILRKAAQEYRKLPPADFICRYVGGGMVCDVYLNGRYITSTTVSNMAPNIFEAATKQQEILAKGQTTRQQQQLYAALLAAGWKPKNIYIAHNEQEYKELTKAYLYEKNPYAYMKERGKEFKESQANLYEKAKEFVALVGEGLSLPAQKLLEKAEKTGGALGKVLTAVGETALFGTGVLTGVMSAWDLPGIVEFGEQLGSGQLVSEIVANPKVMAPLTLGQLAGGILVGKIGSKVGGRTLTRLGVPADVAKVLGVAGEQAMKAAFTYGLVKGMQEKLGKQGVDAVPMFIGLSLMQRGKSKAATAKLKLLTEAERSAEVPLPEAIKLIMEGKAEPTLQIGNQRFVLAKIRTGVGEPQPVLVPEEALADLGKLSKLLGRKVLAVRMAENMPEILAQPKPEELAAYAQQLRKEMALGMEKRAKLLAEELRRTEEQLRDIAEEMKNATPEERAKLQEMLDELAKKAARLRQQLRQEAPWLLPEKTPAEPKPVYQPEGVAQLIEQAEKALSKKAAIEQAAEKAQQQIGKFLETIEKETQLEKVQQEIGTFLEQAEAKLKKTTPEGVEQLIGEFLEQATKTIEPEIETVVLTEKPELETIIGVVEEAKETTRPRTRTKTITVKEEPETKTITARTRPETTTTILLEEPETMGIVEEAKTTVEETAKTRQKARTKPEEEHAPITYYTVLGELIDELVPTGEMAPLTPPPTIAQAKKLRSLLRQRRATLQPPQTTPAAPETALTTQLPETTQATPELATPETELATPQPATTDLKTPTPELATPDLELATPDIETAIETPDITTTTPDLAFETPNIELAIPELKTETVTEEEETKEEEEEETKEREINIPLPIPRTPGIPVRKVTLPEKKQRKKILEELRVLT